MSGTSTCIWACFLMSVERIRDPFLILVLRGWSLTGILDICDVSGTVQFFFSLLLVCFHALLSVVMPSMFLLYGALTATFFLFVFVVLVMILVCLGWASGDQ